VELFEEIRREYEFGVGTIQDVAKKLETLSPLSEFGPVLPGNVPVSFRPSESGTKNEEISAFPISI